MTTNPDDSAVSPNTSANIRKATVEDLRAVSQAIAEAFMDDPLMSWAFEQDVRRSRLDTLFGFFAGHAYLGKGSCTIAANADGATADGAALWTPPGDRMDGELFYANHGEAFLTALEGDVERLGMISEEFGKHHPTDDHWYLFSIGVPPVAQGRGLGGQLLSHTLKQADAQKQPAYLEATSARSRALYERHGFEAVAEVTVDDSPPVWPMWRPPQT